ncbi:putative hydrolase of the HAD superfamily [Cytobacillus firmus]|uniref:Putative hydrolase of the HAD superfamily n=2 Tax=Cytobacillus TaxID=2675230 RepID=A0A366JU61_CYTFI|nr:MULTISPECIES: HAD family hydrolase [Cytobacillus]RBP92422.1 putative hydrolase of the HAD superfamily [Cytobacillus firmus]TDX41893.1 putative hydrolase of the HAD superfamily [Cytobacillus oceanisediminis]
MIKAVIFDFDGTIVDTESLWYEVFKQVLFEDYEFELHLEDFAKGIGTTDDILFDYIDSKLGIQMNRESIQEKTEKAFQSQRDILILREGIQDLIEKCTEKGLKLGVASSSGRVWVKHYLDHFGIEGHFQTIKTKEDVEKVKPDPALYIKALEEIGVEPEESLAIEDSVNGSLAAVQAGMHCAAVPNDVTHFLSFHEKVLRYKAFSEIPIDELVMGKGKG